METLSPVIASLNPDLFSPFAKTIFDRCVTLLGDLPRDSELISSVLDVIGSFENSTTQLSKMVSSSHLIQNLIEICTPATSVDTLTSVFALIGTLVNKCIDLMRPHLKSPLIPFLISEISSTANISKSSNAIWAINCILIRARDVITEEIHREIMQKLVILTYHRNMPKTFLENIATCFSRLTLISFPDPRFAEVALKAICSGVTLMGEDREKADCILAICAMVQAAPLTSPFLMNNVQQIIKALSSWKHEDHIATSYITAMKKLKEVNSINK